MPDNNEGGLPQGNTPKQMPIKYKFRDIKVHSSDEWMADATKKYRKVYDRYETSYMRVEFSFFNKLFDEEEWDATFNLKCFHVHGSQKNELCNVEQKRKILKDENIVYIRDSWGQATLGTYWFKGDYVWEGYIDGVKVGESKFYVEDVGQAKPGENLFFDIDSIKLYEGDGQAYALPQKKFLKKFSQKDTRFVWAEFNFKNKSEKDYFAEVFFNFYDKAGQPKGSSSYVTYITTNTAGKIYTLNPGWGGDAPGRWKSDSYTMEVIFMDNLIATVPFQVGETFDEGQAAVITDTTQLFKPSSAPSTGSSSNKNLEDILNESLAELNSLTGLESVKTEVNEMVKLVRFYQETGKDILNKFSLHTVFTGNPGTGKTTVARILSRIYRGLGILEKGHLIEVDRAGLVAGYVGQTAIKTDEKINEAMGGVLFIDEAYSLAQEKGAQHDFGAEAVQIILKRMEDQRGKFGVIVAGYTENMSEFINSNPGLKSRFDKYFGFEDYSSDEMHTIAQSLFNKEGVKPDAAAEIHLKNYFAFLYEERDKHFGNARTVRQVVGESVKNQNLRLAALKKEERTKELMETIILDDVKEFEIKEVNEKPKIGFRTSGE
ncbi:MAG: AAA family ATPase [Bacteroidetes bacterium]|nr:AAA family ATPase [Bacteroidota bacterium]MBI3481766.1 AAA family ATPase [Bacteroidota bacterium]